MILWIDGAHDAAENMHRDAGLLGRLESASGAAIVRLYRFDPPGITLGYGQRAELVLDLDACAAAGVTWARRPTGGRAVYHDQEWTYALAARIDDPLWGGSLREAYARASMLIRDALRRIGIPAELAVARRRAGSAVMKDPACFASTARHEITLEGRKLVGSAQRRLSRALIQQGSVLTGPSHAQLGRFLRDPAGRAAAERRLLEDAADPGARWHAAPIGSFAEAVQAVAAPARVLRADEGLTLLTGFRNGLYPPGESRTGTGDSPPHKEMRA